jgi:hypothetical protein
MKRAKRRTSLDIISIENETSYRISQKEIEIFRKLAQKEKTKDENSFCPYLCSPVPPLHAGFYRAEIGHRLPSQHVVASSPGRARKAGDFAGGSASRRARGPGVAKWREFIPRKGSLAHGDRARYLFTDPEVLLIPC